MARLLDNFYILKTESGIKLTYVRSVPGEGDLYGERNPENGKDVCNLRRAKSAFLDLGQCNQWQYMGTFTAAADDRKKTFDGLRSGLKIGIVTMILRLSICFCLNSAKRGGGFMLIRF